MKLAYLILCLHAVCNYCNSLLAGAALATLGPLQRAQNAAARLLFELTPTRDHNQSKYHCSFTGYQYARASSISCSALCTLYTPENAQLIWRTLYNLQPLDSHDLIYGLRRQPIFFRGSRPSSVSVRSHTLVRPRGTHCPHTSAMFLVLTVSESFSF